MINSKQNNLNVEGLKMHMDTSSGKFKSNHKNSSVSNYFYEQIPNTQTDIKEDEMNGTICRKEGAWL